MKRLFAVMLAVLLVMQISGQMAVGAAQTQTMTVTSASGKVGDTVSVDVVLENNPGISSAVVKVCYDESRLTLVSAEIDSQFSSGAFVNYNLPYMIFVRADNVDADGVFATLQFQIKSESGNGNVTIEFSDGDITDIDENDVSFQVTGGTISIASDALTLGDLDLDSDVDADDLTCLARHVGGIALITGQALDNADVNSDGEVDSEDLTTHARYVGGIITEWNQ